MPSGRESEKEYLPTNGPNQDSGYIRSEVLRWRNKFLILETARKTMNQWISWFQSRYVCKTIGIAHFPDCSTRSNSLPWMKMGMRMCTL